jgi:photosystem II stability/assembly factor-like uncharacterized protein
MKSPEMNRIPAWRPSWLPEISKTPNNSSYLLVATAVIAGLFTLGNCGLAQSWSPTSAPERHWTCVASSADGSKLVAVTYTNGIYTSTDSGATWKQTSAPVEPWFGAAASADGTKLVAHTIVFLSPPFGDPTGGSIYTSTNAGTTWTKTSAPNLPWFGVACSADGNKLVAPTLTDGIYISTDSGITWAQTSAPNSPWSCVASSADGTKLVAGLDPGGIYASPDSGTTWTPTGAPENSWQDIACSADGRNLVASSGGDSLFVSTDSGGSWKRTSTPVRTWGHVASSADGVRLVAAAFGDLIYVSTNSGVTWKATDVPISDWLAVASSADGCKLVAGVSGVSTDNPGPIYTMQSTPAPLLSISPSGSGFMLSWTIPSENFVLQNSSDLVMTNWTMVPSPRTVDFNNIRYQVTLPAVNRYIFYRLTMP